MTSAADLGPAGRRANLIVSSPMRLRHIEVFNAIYLSGTISRAAEQLHVSQPSLSKTLQHAEDQLGFKLFRRVRGRLIPTDEAHIVYRECCEVYSRLETLQTACRNLRAGIGGHIRIAVVHAAGILAAPAAIGLFRQRRPEVSFEIRTFHQEECLRALFDRSSEVALIWGSPLHPRVHSEKIAQAELVVVFPKGQFADVRGRIPLSTLSDKDVIGISTSGPVGDLLDANLAKIGGPPYREVVTTHTFFVATALVREGVGMAVVDELTARSVAQEGLEFRRIDPPIRVDICAAHLEDRPPSHVVQQFVATLRSKLEQTLGA